MEDGQGGGRRDEEQITADGWERRGMDKGFGLAEWGEAWDTSRSEGLRGEGR